MTPQPVLPVHPSGRAADDLSGAPLGAVRANAFIRLVDLLGDHIGDRAVREELHGLIRFLRDDDIRAAYRRGQVDGMRCSTPVFARPHTATARVIRCDS